jgi:hypothetical protein
MRLEFNLELERIQVPRFAVEAVEGIGKIFTLATLVLNVLEMRDSVEIVFHGLSPEDPVRKMAGFKEIVQSTPRGALFEFTETEVGLVQGSSSYYQWLTISPNKG